MAPKIGGRFLIVHIVRTCKSVCFN